MFLSKYLIVSLPALVLVAAVGITRIPGRAVAAVLVLALVSLSTRGLADWYQRTSFEDWRGAARYVLATTHVGDGVVFYPRYASVPFGYYERREGAPELENLDPRGQLVERWRVKRRIWLVVREGDAARAPLDLRRLKRALAGKYRPAGRRTFDGVMIELFHRVA
jgi:hypothetical protein